MGLSTDGRVEKERVERAAVTTNNRAVTTKRLLQRMDGVSSESKQMLGARVPHLLFRGVDVST